MIEHPFYGRETSWLIRRHTSRLPERINRNEKIELEKTNVIKGNSLGNLTKPCMRNEFRIVVVPRDEDGRHRNQIDCSKCCQHLCFFHRSTLRDFLCAAVLPLSPHIHLPIVDDTPGHSFSFPLVSLSRSAEHHLGNHIILEMTLKTRHDGLRRANKNEEKLHNGLRLSIY